MTWCTRCYREKCSIYGKFLCADCPIERFEDYVKKGDLWYCRRYCCGAQMAKKYCHENNIIIKTWY